MAFSFASLLALFLLFATVGASESKDSFSIPMSYEKDESQLPQVGSDAQVIDTKSVEDSSKAQPDTIPEFSVWSSGTSGTEEGVEVVGEDAVDLEEPVQAHAEPKREWPELVGMTGEEAKAAVEQSSHGLSVYIVPENAFVTMDFRTNRLRIFVDKKGIVSSVPRIG